MDKRGQAGMGGIKAVFTTIAALAMIAWLVVLITGKFRSQIDLTGLPSEYNSTVDSIDSNVTSGLDLMSLAIYILPAVAIIAVVIAYLG